MLVRHGDVLVQSVKSLPKGSMKRPGLIFGSCEATGHSHRIKERAAPVVCIAAPMVSFWKSPPRKPTRSSRA